VSAIFKLKTELGLEGRLRR